MNKVQSYLSRNTTAETALNAYDMVWSMGATFAAAARASSSAQEAALAGGPVPMPSGSEVVAAFPEVSFNGASGPLSLESNGDRSVTDLMMRIVNLVWNESTGKYETHTVGQLTYDDNQQPQFEFNQAPDAVLTWSDGSQYPQVGQTFRPFPSRC